LESSGEFKKLTRTAGLGDWTPYEIRHGAASLLVAMGVSIEEVADLFGHKDATTLMSVYRHNMASAVDAGSTAIASVPANPAQSHA